MFSEPNLDLYKSIRHNLKNSINIQYIFYTYIPEHIQNYEYYRSFLDNEEIKKADRFYFDKDRICYTLARAKLRLLLSEFTDINPKEIIFKYNDYNKPYIENELHFNISHSKDFIVYTFSLFEIGIDIEYMKENIRYKDLIKRYFSDSEIKEFLNVPEDKQKEAFFNGWSRKEAYIKAVGRGLNILLNSFDVSLNPDKKAELINIDGNKNTIWNLYDFNIHNDYKSAIAINCSNNFNIKICSY